MPDPIHPLGAVTGLSPLAALSRLASQNPAANGAAGASFAEQLQQALNEVNRLQLEAGRQDELLATGDLKDLHSAVIAAEKASLALQLTLQVRNKVLEAYQEVMRMQV